MKNEQHKLFNIEPIKQVENKNTCKDCEHRQRWDFNGKIFQYCGVRKSKRTQNGLLKIKCKNQACLSFELTNNKTK